MLPTSRWLLASPRDLGGPTRGRKRSSRLRFIAGSSRSPAQRGVRGTRNFLRSQSLAAEDGTPLLCGRAAQTDVQTETWRRVRAACFYLASASSSCHFRPLRSLSCPLNAWQHAFRRSFLPLRRWPLNRRERHKELSIEMPMCRTIHILRVGRDHDEERTRGRRCR